MTSVAAENVYRPQEDSLLLIEALAGSDAIRGGQVLDLCTGSGLVAIAAAEMGAGTVTALDNSATAVDCATANVSVAEVDVEVVLGSWSKALDCGPFDAVVCNPPYVPTSRDVDPTSIASWSGPADAWSGGEDGRLVLDPLCDTVSSMLAEGGSLFMVQSEFAGVDESVARLCRSGLSVVISATRSIPWGPVVCAQAEWLIESGRLSRRRQLSREERLFVIRAVKS